MAVTSVQFSVASHIMAVLGFYYGTEVTSATCAYSVNAEPSFVRKSLSKLVKAGLVVASRGKNGACSLARPPEEITLRDIYRASESPTTLAIHNYPVEGVCAISLNIKGCMLGIQAKAQASFEESLGETTLADLVADIRRCAGQ